MFGVSDLVVFRFGGVTINTDEEKCKDEEEFEKKLVCKFL